jgi:hypothetical protein
VQGILGTAFSQKMAQQDLYGDAIIKVTDYKPYISDYKT